MKVIDYMKWRGDIPFSVSPFNDVDCYILSKAGSPDFTGIVPEKGYVRATEAIERYFTEKGAGLGLLASEHIIESLKMMPSCVRYNNLQFGNYKLIVDENNCEQFSAMMIILDDGTEMIVYRGTDDTLLGWKENFMMSVDKEVPAQKSALNYLNDHTNDSDSPLIVAGHSKGGNLAMYAAVNTPVSNHQRITAVYNFDGPGLHEDVFSSMKYLVIADKIKTIMSDHAIIGLLLNYDKNSMIVETDCSGIAAHDGFKWEVCNPFDGSLGFIRAKDYAGSSKAIQNAIEKVQQEMSEEEKLELIEDFFGTLEKTGAKTLSDLSARKVKETLVTIRDLRKDETIKKFIGDLIENIVSYSWEKAKEFVIGK